MIFYCDRHNISSDFGCYKCNENNQKILIKTQNELVRVLTRRDYFEMLDKIIR